MKSFIAKRVNSILVNLRYLRFKLLKYKGNKKICNTFDHNFKNIPLYMRKVSLDLFSIIRWCLYFNKMSKMTLNSFCDKNSSNNYVRGVIKPCTVKPRYNETLGTMKITLLYQVSCYIRVKKQRNIKSWDQQNDLVIRGFCYIRPLYNEVPL